MSKENVDEAMQWFALNGEAVATVNCVSDNVSDRHRRAFEKRVTVRRGAPHALGRRSSVPRGAGRSWLSSPTSLPLRPKAELAPTP